MKMKAITSFLAVTLLIVSLSLAGTVPINKVSAAEIIFKERLRGDEASAQGLIRDGSIETTTSAVSFMTQEGDIAMCFLLQSFDQSTGQFLISYFSCAPAQLTVAGGLGSATFSATFTDIEELVSGQLKTLTVNAELFPTGKVQTTTMGTHINTRDVTQVFKSNGMFRSASGTINISGDESFSFEDVTGHIGKIKSGSLIIQKN